MTLERPADRLALVTGLVVLTLASPNISLPGSLPAVRLEQIALALAVLPLVVFVRRNPEFRRLGLVDLAFAGLTIAMGMTILVVPVFVAGVDRSPRDALELVRVFEYWLAYRLGVTLSPADVGGWRLARLLAVAAAVLGVCAIVQYLDPAGFNATVTSFWTRSHNLDGVIRGGRVVGTAGNANQFGVLTILLLLIALAGRLTVSRASGRWMWTSAVVGSLAGLILAQSRGALLGAAAALVTALILLKVRRSLRHGIIAAGPPMIAGAVLIVGLALAVPPATGSILNRFDLTAIVRDPSVIIRIARAESLLGATRSQASPTAGDPTACASNLTPVSSPGAGHERSPSGPVPAPSETAARLSFAVVKFRCATGAWPTDIRRDLVPAYLPAAIPSLDQFGVYSSPRGFEVGLSASVDRASEAPGVGSLPNLLYASSFENSGNALDGWLATPQVVTAASAQSAFGKFALDATLPKEGAIYQLVVADLPPNSVYTFGMWAKPLGTAGGSVQLYVVAMTASGARIDPLASKSVTIPAGAGWQHAGLNFRIPSENLFSLQVMIRASDRPMRVLLDGASLTEGPFALPFASLSDRPVSGGAGSTRPVLRDSPLLGVGPESDGAVAVLDNEYASFLYHYGVVGLIGYLLLFASVFITGVRVALLGRPWDYLLGVSLAAFTVALGVSAISVGAFHQLQTMFIFWLLAGASSAILRTLRQARSGDRVASA